MSLLLALALQAATAEPEFSDNQEIVVTATRLGNWRGKFSLRGEKFKCKTIVSTDDKGIDAIGCNAIRQCLHPLKARLTESDNKTLGKDRQRELKKAIFDDLGICVKETRAKMVAEFVSQRKATQ
jgi:hypothetical protein